jgi:hypothetical protein
MKRDKLIKWIIQRESEYELKHPEVFSRTRPVAPAVPAIRVIVHADLGTVTPIIDSDHPSTAALTVRTVFSDYR